MTRSGARFLAYLRARFPGCADAVLREALVIRRERAAPRLGRRHLVKAMKRVCQLPLPGGFSPSPVE
jgi:hypothetical protein